MWGKGTYLEVEHARLDVDRLAHVDLEVLAERLAVSSVERVVDTAHQPAHIQHQKEQIQTQN